MIMKYLLLFALLFVAYIVWRNKRIEHGTGERDAATPRPTEMVSCPVCGLHLPRPEAVAGSDGRFYCSPEHRQRAGR